ncbi:MAG: DUF1700 domain-containing protein [Lachnospiraceae bacterium]|nr:DUF1700 domain-containing protein [Lachnospiraceae bacterium]
MSRWEFMRRLEELLSDISPNEREEALQYYNDYFNDAGKENEKEVIDALGSPEQVAKIVKDGLGDNVSQGEFTENGFINGPAYAQNEIMKRTPESRAEGSFGDNLIKEESGAAGEDGSRQRDAAYTSSQNSYGQGNSADGHNTGSYSQGNSSNGQNNDPYGQDDGTYGQNDGVYSQSQNSEGQKEGKDNMPTWAIVLIVIGCILFSPAILGIVCAAFAVIIGVIAAAVGIVFGSGLAMIILYIVGISLVVAGLGCMFAHPLTGIGLLGGGFLCGALGILFMLLTGFLAGKCIPGIFQGISYICKKIFGNKGGSKG